MDAVASIAQTKPYTAWVLLPTLVVTSAARGLPGPSAASSSLGTLCVFRTSMFLKWFVLSEDTMRRALSACLRPPREPR